MSGGHLFITCISQPVATQGRLVSLLGILLVLVFTVPALAQEPELADRVGSLALAAHEGAEAAERNNTSLMQHEYDEIHEAWERFEDEVRAQSPTGYVQLEGAMAAVKSALGTQPLDPAAVETAYLHLQEEATEIAAEMSGPVSKASSGEATPAELLKSLNEAYEEVEQGQTQEAAEQMKQIIRAWPAVEGAVAARDAEAYTAIEVDLGQAITALEAQPADLAAAEAAIERLRDNLAPFAVGQTYTMFDSAAIILREGLEALLVIVALLAFLRRSGNSDKRGWIWAGSGLGVLASLATAFVLQAIFSRASAGQNREVIEGITGLAAAGLLFYVSYWLHSKANLRSWQKYINTQTTRALARGSAFGLALLAFLAVFREGAETAVFYLGMAASISLENLLLGFGLGLAVLAVVAVLMLGVGLRLPLRPFFQIAGLMVYYLGFKFLGSGIHALQVSGLFSSSSIPGLPAVPLLGFYPTWETAGLQALLLLAAVVVFLYLRWQEQQAHEARSPAAV